VFVDVGRTLQHELSSRATLPPAPLEFRAEYDRVSSVKLLEALRQTPDDKSGARSCWRSWPRSVRCAACATSLASDAA